MYIIKPSKTCKQNQLYIFINLMEFDLTYLLVNFDTVMATTMYQRGCSACVAAAIQNGGFERLRELMRIPGVRYDETCWVETDNLEYRRQKLMDST